MKGGGFWHAILLLIVTSMIMGVIQLGIVFLIAFGFIFRTRETIGMLTVFFLLGLIDRYPWATIGGLALISLLAFSPRCSKTEESGQRLLPPPSRR